MPVKVKICGLTNLEDARAALEAGADFLGFIFYPKSKRFIQPDKVREILSKLDCSRVKTVGVFVNEEAHNVHETLQYCGLDFAQLHGGEPPQMVISSEIDGQENPLYGNSYKAIKPRDLQEAKDLAARYVLPDEIKHKQEIPALLLDTYDPILPGGTGRTADKNIALELSGRYPLLLAGGLTIQNMGQLLEEISPWGIDVASGTEASPGVKDHHLVKEFIRIAKEIRL